MSRPNFRYPKEINLVPSNQALEVIWDDGHQTVFPLQRLRALCACANCTDVHNTGAKPAGALSLPVLGAANKFDVRELSHVGRYALGVLWQDQHDSIYPYDVLAFQCPCLECTTNRETAQNA